MLDLVDDLGDDLAGRGPGGVGQQPVELDEQRDEVQVGLDAREHLRFEQQLAEVEPLDRIALQAPARPASGSSAGCRRASGPPTAPNGPSPPARPPPPRRAAPWRRTPPPRAASMRCVVAVELHGGCTAPAGGIAGVTEIVGAAEHQPPAAHAARDR